MDVAIWRHLREIVARIAIVPIHIDIWTTKNFIPCNLITDVLYMTILVFLDLSYMIVYSHYERLFFRTARLAGCKDRHICVQWSLSKYGTNLWLVL